MRFQWYLVNDKHNSFMWFDEFAKAIGGNIRINKKVWKQFIKFSNKHKDINQGEQFEVFMSKCKLVN